MTDLVTVLRVFVDADGALGNPLGVVRSPVDPDRRQSTAAELGFSETVFVDETAPESPVVAIFTPAVELPFAGHPLVGTAWLLGREAEQHRPAPGSLRVAAGTVPVEHAAGGMTWIAGRAEWAPAFTFRQLGSVAEIDALDPADPGGDHVYSWAWEDEPAGWVRARLFAPAMGTVEDEATGSAAVRLGAQLGRRLRIRQGRGSLIQVEPAEDGTVRVGGRTVHAGTRPIP